MYYKWESGANKLWRSISAMACTTIGEAKTQTTQEIEKIMKKDNKIEKNRGKQVKGGREDDAG